MKHNEIKELINIFDESDITRLKINDKDFSITLEKGKVVAEVPVIAPAVAASPVVESVIDNVSAQSSTGETIDSPMVGTFYIAPSPGAAHFVKVGDVVSAGQTIAIVEAMKIMNEIEAEYSCKIVKILVNDGQPVEFGTALFEVEKV